ncbi:MAG: hypothetical protein NDI90_14200 [Nitrospira sp. BO4]|jgi:hypothetical protein|nr:hypothetical protein [Nitrospira sp. BO4]
MANSRRSSTTALSQEEIASELKKHIRKVLDKKGWDLPSHCKEDKIAQFLRSSLQKLGEFYRQSDGVIWFFRHHNHKLYEVTTHPESAFAKYITSITDQSVTFHLLRRSLDRLHAAMLEEAKLVEVHGIAYNAHDLSVIAVSDFGGGMWYRNQGGQWEWKPNGSEGIFFWSPNEKVQKWVPQFNTDSTRQAEDAFQWFIQQPHFAEHDLTIRDQRLLFRAVLLVPLFPSLNHTRPVSAHLGLSQDQQHDTGKTTAGKMIGVVWEGPAFQPTPMDGSEKGKEALSLLLGQTPFVLLDNADTQTKWLNDYICTYATGGQMSKRKLYSDATLVYFEPKARLCVTSRKASFNREDVATRIIPFRFAPIGDEERKTEAQLLNPVIAKRGQIWAGILQVVAQIQDNFSSLNPPQPTARLADFDSFGWRVSSLYGEGNAWRETMSCLKTAQAGFSLEDNPLLPILRDWLSEGDIPEMPTLDFFDKLSDRAQGTERPSGFPRTAASCTTQLKTLKKLFETELKARISFRTLNGKSLIQISRV